MSIPRRVIGIETEYGITCASRTGGQPPLSAEEAAQKLFRPVLEMTRSTNTFLDNGARLYLDVGSHPEYATAECDTLTDLIAQDRAGELLFDDLVTQANTRLEAEGIEGEIHLFKNNNDAAGNSFGCHENYLVHRRSDFRAKIQALLPFFVTRQLVSGAGYIHTDEAGVAHYEFSQRARRMDDAISSASTRTRPMLNTRDEPHADAEKYRRMHVIVGDSNIAQATTGVKVAITEAVLMCIEGTKSFPTFQLDNPVQAIRDTSADMSGRARLALSDGTYAHPLDIQRTVRDYVMDYLEKSGLWSDFDPVRRYFMELWTRTLDAVDTGDYSSISTEIDWAAKLSLLNRYMERGSLSLNDPRIARLDLAYHDITAGLRLSMESSGLLRTIVSDDDVRTAMTTPPQTTRAKIRGDFVKAARQSRRDFVVDWMHVRLLEARGARSVAMPDPFTVVDENVERLIEEINEV